MKEKIRRKKCNRSDNSLQSRLDYLRYDNGPNAMDVPSDIPSKDLHNLESSPNITTTKSVSIANPWLSASPDRMVHDPAHFKSSRWSC